MIALNPTSQFIVSMFKSIDSQTFKDLPQFFDRQAVYERPGFDPIKGLDALDHFYRHVRIIRSGEHRLDRIISEGEAAVAVGRFVGELKDGTQTDEPFADHYVFQNGIITLRKPFFFRPAI